MKLKPGWYNSMIEKINGIYRLTFNYVGLIQRNVSGYRKFVLPSKPVTFFRNMLNLMGLRFNYNKLTSEKAIIDFHDMIYKSSHKILAVGVGTGISLIYNSKLPRENKFIGIEASIDQIELTKKNVKLNQIPDSRYQIIEGFAGNPKGVYGEKSQISKKKVDINEYDFDVLELDCEGSEIGLLENLSKHPKYIIVEMHPTIININISEVLANLKTKGYKLIKAKTVVGKNIDIDNLEDFFDSEIVKRKIDEKQSWGNILPVLLFEG